MHRTVLILLMAALSSCISIEMQTEVPATVRFVTSTLPPTREGAPVPSRSASATTPAPTLEGTVPANCTQRAVLLEDVTIPDNTSLLRGQAFTKTWRLKNTGTCPWKGYMAAFIAGDRLGAPDRSPVPQTAADAAVDISIELTAPTSDGLYTGYFELRDADDEVVPIGIQASFWVRIVIGNVSLTPGPAGTPVGVTPLYTPGGPLSCDYFLSTPYHNEIAALINSARAGAGLSALRVDARLAAAAQDHSIDMACFGNLSHTGSDSSSPGERVAAAGYSGILEEVIYGSGYPQTAFDWWMADAIHRHAILNPSAAAMGVGYAYVATSLYGGYYTVDFGSQ